MAFLRDLRVLVIYLVDKKANRSLKLAVLDMRAYDTDVTTTRYPNHTLNLP